MAAPIIIVKDGSLSIEIKEMRGGKEEPVATLKLDDIKPAKDTEWILRFPNCPPQRKDSKGEFRFKLEELTMQQIDELFGPGDQGGEASQST